MKRQVFHGSSSLGFDQATNEPGPDRHMSRLFFGATIERAQLPNFLVRFGQECFPGPGSL